MASTDGGSLAIEASKDAAIVNKSKNPKTLTSNGLLSPRSTPDVDDARLKADKDRQQLSDSEEKHESEPQAPSNKGKGRAELSLDKPTKSDTPKKPPQSDTPKKPPQSDTPKKPPQSDDPKKPPQSDPPSKSDGKEGQGEPSGKDRPRPKYTEEQKGAEVERIMNVNPVKYYRVLNVKDTDDRAEIRKSYKELCLMVHPDKNKHPEAEDAFKAIDAAAKELGVDDQYFAENGYGKESDNPLPTPPLKMDKAPRPPKFALQVYEEATAALARLMNDTDDMDALKTLAGYNSQIIARNEADHRPKLDFEIPVETLQAHFKAIESDWQRLKADPADSEARGKVVQIDEILEKLIEQRGLPKHWRFNLPAVPQISEDVDMTGTAELKGRTGPHNGSHTSSMKGVKTKINVSLPDESNGNTSLGQVTTVKKAGGNGFRVIVNRGTEEHPYFNIYPGNTFGNGVAAGWYESNLYNSEDLPAKVAIDGEVTLYGRVTVARPRRSRYRPGSGVGGGISRPIQFYMCRVGEKEFVSTKTALLKAKGNSVRKQKIRDRELDREGAVLLKELDDFRRENKHPDTGEQLTHEEIEKMPWLSSDAIADDIDNDDEEISLKQEDDEKDDIKFRVAPRKPLGRSADAADAASTNPEPKSPSVESDL